MNFTDANLTHYALVNARPYGDGSVKAAWLNGLTSSAQTRFVTPWLVNAWALKPDVAGKIAFEAYVPQSEDRFHGKAAEFDAFLRETARVGGWLDGVELRPMIKPGTLPADGLPRDATMRFAVDGWNEAVDSVTTDFSRGGFEYVKVASWKPVTTASLGERATRFYLAAGTDAASGNERFSSEIACPDGSLRAVGPQDVPAGASVKIVFSLSRAYIGKAAAGWIVTADKVLVRPRAIRALTPLTLELEGIKLF